MRISSTGFSLIELTVVLVLVSLLSSLVLPSLANAYTSASIRSELEQMRLHLSDLGYQAFSLGRSIKISSEEDVIEHLNPPEGWIVVINQPVEITQVGVCRSGELQLTKGEFSKVLRMVPPYCGVSHE